MLHYRSPKDPSAIQHIVSAIKHTHADLAVPNPNFLLLFIALFIFVNTTLGGTVLSIFLTLCHCRALRTFLFARYSFFMFSIELIMLFLVMKGWRWSLTNDRQFHSRCLIHTILIFNKASFHSSSISWLISVYWMLDYHLLKYWIFDIFHLTNTSNHSIEVGYPLWIINQTDTLDDLISIGYSLWFVKSLDLSNILI